MSGAHRPAGIPLERDVLGRPAHVVAPDLLGKLLVVADGDDVRHGRIVEVEAYEEHEAASHTFRGRTPRNAVMFGEAGHLYVYFSYGVHWCANVVCDQPGRGAAVLVRALAPLGGLDAMVIARPTARRTVDLCNGPGKLCAALGLTGADNGADLVGDRGPQGAPTGGAPRTVRLLDDGTPAPTAPGRSARIGISKAVELPWRWFVDGDPHVSGSRGTRRLGS